MIYSFFTRKYELLLIGLHVFLGIVSLFTPWALIAWIYILIISSLLVTQDGKTNVHLLLAYLVGFEILCRMTGTSPWVPWEVGKYLGFVLLVYGIIMDKGAKSSIGVGVLIVLMCVPAWLMGNEEFDRKAFSMLGIIDLGLFVAYFKNRGITIRELNLIFKLLIYPLISILTYITISTPSFAEVDFQLGANSQTTGGFGSNQISTILSIGFFLIGIIYLLGGQLFKWSKLNLLLLAYFIFRSLITFSRGGVLVAIVALVYFAFRLSFIKNTRILGLQLKKINFTSIFVGLLILSSVAVVGNELTRGSLFLRYQGETQGTLEGTKAKTLNSITTNRWSIMLSDLKIWSENPLLGVGGGNSASLRNKYGTSNIVAHTEFTRVLSEQGVFGIVILCILFFRPITIFFSEDKLTASLTLCFWLLAIGTAFHAGMRTLVTPFFFGLSFIQIVSLKETNPFIVSNKNL